MINNNSLTYFILSSTASLPMYKLYDDKPHRHCSVKDANNTVLTVHKVRGGPKK